VRERPKKPRTMVMIKKAKRAMIRPMMEAMMVFRALSTLALSPPDVIQRIPPKIRKKRAMRAAAIRTIVTMVAITVPILVESRVQREAKVPATEPPAWQGLTFV